MPFNWQIFKTRTLSAILFVAFMGAGLFINPWLFLLLFLIIHIGCWIEYQTLLIKIDTRYNNASIFHKIGIIVAGTAFMLWCTSDYYTINDLNIHALGWWILLLTLFVFPIIEILFSKKILLINVIYSIVGFLYISVSLGCILLLRNITVQQNANPHQWNDAFYSLPIFLIFCIWVNDTMAYIIGSIMGKTSLSSISPNKTWEGTIGGIIACISIMVGLSYLLHWLPWQHALAISAIAAIVGTCGDLLESKLKRIANVKDSGKLMPGHGGFLDRFDSLLLAIPFVWFYTKLYWS